MLMPDLGCSPNSSVWTNFANFWKKQPLVMLRMRISNQRAESALGTSREGTREYRVFSPGLFQATCAVVKRKKYENN